MEIQQHRNEAVEEVRRSEMQRLSKKEKVGCKRRRWLLLKNPWNLNADQKECLSTLVRWNAPIVRACYLQEAFQLFWEYRQPGSVAIPPGWNLALDTAPAVQRRG